jgi:phage baseplate assembly protein W
MLIYKQFSVLVGGLQYLIDGNFQWDWRVEDNSVELVLSNVFNLLSTPYGTQPLLRTFGLSSSWIDQPGTIGLMQGKVAALLAISLWEPRAKVINLEFVLNPSDLMGGRYSVQLEIEVNLQQQLQTLLFAPPTPQNVWVLDAPFDGTYPTAQLEQVTI